MAQRPREKILILGGTAEAAALARRLVAEKPEAEIITSLAGRVIARRPLPGTVRIGGFGGVEGMIKYLRQAKITRVIDSTHPFAAVISAQARTACAKLRLPLNVLERPMWTKHPGDCWHWADDMAMAARMAAKARRVFITVGTKELLPFARWGGPFYVVRLIEPPPRPLPFRHYGLVLGRGPFTVAEELTLLRTFDIDLVVTKASGGAATEAKLIAARKLGIPVLLVKRPR
ncbi:MAG TPA: cobalt-precorrin-6A reductase [Magnetospirillaceae bacterium]|jgi:precorrin-6A/cobalt-precorrin-6A reductase